jgi:16S rRNA (guanine527-N7)-methyltransferase
MSLEIKQCLALALQHNNYIVSAECQAKLLAFLQLLQKWNNVFNLTAIARLEAMIYRHIIDSLAVAPYLYGNKLLDLGSGGGLPGVPLAIINNSQFWVLLDKNRKKTQFLTQVVAELALTNVKVYCDRGETFNSVSGFDTIITRALGDVKLFLTIAGHLGQNHCHFLAMKGVYPAQELAELPQGFKLLASYQLNIHGLAATRHLVTLVKDH